VDFPEFACDFSISDGIEKVAENGVRNNVHVGAFAVSLQRLKSLNCVLLNHGVFDLRHGWNQQFNLPSLRFAANPTASQRLRSLAKGLTH